MKICFLSTQAFSVNTLAHLCASGKHDIVVCGIDPDTAARAKVSGYADYAPEAHKLGLPYYAVHAFNLSDARDTAFFESSAFDVIVALGWNRLIPDRLIESTRYGVIGSHSSPHALPFGRGRSPVVWSIVLGFAQITSQLFRIDSGVDTGEVLASRVIPIGPEDSTQILYYKIALGHALMLEEALENLKAKRYLPASGLPDLVLPKRGPADANIDWRHAAQRIHDLVRAVSPPFHGAFFGLGGKKYVLTRSKVWDGLSASGKPGEVIAGFPDGAALVATGQGCLLLLEHNCALLKRGSMLESLITDTKA
ncbi:UDP-4-amino-4-deoxy-L-arabinose formyltransferase / UDP-glucuronic acid dehydrogenase [Cyclonatronum proteinivorum]|uniref:Methionyl-tRNA formyltransferase n=1 Tax=Cyclonatronum proteinivorum TaxID=1457365 RepID=A0A345UMM7_9BACT|nr:formyltransferase family protein [Cyclonatronum proteinivorum]AXJ01729.1 UDP-4-amino-4-deoxy-L-arabinose formyltransferase / UDP-glucuronic acid dehydrogenase [Cyclonatronum proteinivorum]